MPDAVSHKICLALGSNVGDRLGSLRAAVEALRPYVKIIAASRIYETDPVYATDQPAFLNAAVTGTTALAPEGLLYTLKDIETDLGRQPTFRYGPRVIDIDILFYDDLVLRAQNLTIPHALMHERLFVLRPLADVAPDWVHPVLGETVATLLSCVLDKSGVFPTEDSLLPPA
jgi:2-amino-4-hydroxy-6-hydroxymethyldihydropteridine diphosphokinase